MRLSTHILDNPLNPIDKKFVLNLDILKNIYQQDYKIVRKKKIMMMKI